MAYCNCAKGFCFVLVLLLLAAEVLVEACRIFSFDMWDLVSRDGTVPPALEAQSLNPSSASDRLREKKKPFSRKVNSTKVK